MPLILSDIKRFVKRISFWILSLRRNALLRGPGNSPVNKQNIAYYCFSFLLSQGIAQKIN